MLSKLFGVFFKAMKPKRTAAFLGFLIFPIAAAAAIFSKRTHFRNDSGVDADMYVIGKKGNPKAVFVTNVSRRKILKKMVEKPF